jgi:hypothetical protein
LSLHAYSIVDDPLRLYYEPLKLSIDYNGDPDPAFHSNADTDLDPHPCLINSSVLSSRQLYRCFNFQYFGQYPILNFSGKSVPDPGSGAFLAPGPGSVIRNRFYSGSQPHIF